MDASRLILTHQIQLGIQPLCNSALADIEGKVTLDNVAEELFSQVTTRCGVPSDSNPEVSIGLTCPFSQEKVMEVQCELLISNFKDPKTIALVEETIGHISDGSSPHSADALKLWLKKAFEVKQQKKLGPGVLLRCSRSGCARYDSPVTRRVAGSDIWCQLCKHSYGDYVLRCSSCGSDRSVHSMYTCGGWNCGRKFA